MSTDSASKKSKAIARPGTTKGYPSNRFCRYIHRHCFQERIHNYDFCIRHILEDTSAPFKRCSFVQQPSRKRCTNAAPKLDKTDKREELCPFHAKQSLKKIQATFDKKKLKGPPALLRTLEHYCDNSGHKQSDAGKFEFTTVNQHIPNSLKPPSEFKENDEFDPISSESYHRFDDHRDFEDPDEVLKHAGVLTAKESVRIAQSKASQLKDLYTNALKHCFLELRNAYMEFLREVKIEEGSNKGMPAGKMSQVDHHLRRYHSHGIHKVLKRKVLERTKKQTTTMKPRCVIEENGKKCSEEAVELTDYCFNHLKDHANTAALTACTFGFKQEFDKSVLTVDDSMFLSNAAEKFPTESEEKGQSVDPSTELEHFQSMDDIASLELDDPTFGCLFGLNQYGEPGESMDTGLSEGQGDLMQIQPI